MEDKNQDELKLSTKLWLKANGFSYAWLAERCYVSETTVRNWMARKTIPAAKEYIIREIIRQGAMSVPERVHVKEETLVTVTLDSSTRKLLEQRAMAEGCSLSEFLARSLSRIVADGADF